MFERVVSLIGNENFNKLNNIKVLIVGIGGVGGYALETLVRSGVNNIDIVDFDKIDITNLNRQIITNNKNIDKYKVDEAKLRAESINPNINLQTFKLFLDESNINDILNNNYDYVIDACDFVPTKIELIKQSIDSDFKLITCMGTAKKIDPAKLEITTLDKTDYDKLAKVMRKKLRELNINLKKVVVVSSKEKNIETNNLGSLMMTPATAGILCAKYVIENTINS